MHWWCWIILAVLMLAALVVGLVYAGIHAVRAARVVAATGENVQDYLSAMTASSKNEEQTPEPPLFTQPLSLSAHRYSLAQTVVEERRISKHIRHAERWDDWKHRHILADSAFNTSMTPTGSVMPSSQSTTFDLREYKR